MAAAAAASPDVVMSEARSKRGVGDGNNATQNKKTKADDGLDFSASSHSDDVFGESWHHHALTGAPKDETGDGDDDDDDISIEMQRNTME
jgi:hypothetical protein